MKKKILIIGFFGILLMLQPLNAQTWTTTKRLTWNPGESYLPAIAVDSNNNIHMVWHENAPGNAEVYYKRSANGGATWTTKRLTYNLGGSSYPAVAVDPSNNIHVVWHDTTPGSADIYYKKSTDGGTTWTTKRLTYNLGYSSRTAIAADSNSHIHVVWQDNIPGKFEIFYKKSTTAGSTWTTKRLTYTSNDQYYPAIAADSNNHLHVVWYDSSPGKFEIKYKKSTNGGTTWTTKRLTYNPGLANSPAIAIGSNDHLHVVWYDSTPGNGEIYYKKSTDSGTTWTTKRLTYNAGNSDNPAIAIDSNNRIHLVWDDSTSGNREIYYKRSTNGGATWTTKRLAFNSGESWISAIAVNSDNDIFVVWGDDTPGNREIYFKKGNQ
jgi:hypothetical protein